LSVNFPLVQKGVDYLIIGSGSVGCVLADRLSESGKFDALLLEAGRQHQNILLRKPLFYAACSSIFIDV